MTLTNRIWQGFGFPDIAGLAKPKAPGVNGLASDHLFQGYPKVDAPQHAQIGSPGVLRDRVVAQRPGRWREQPSRSGGDNLGYIELSK